MNKIEHYTDLNLIDDFAVRFGLHPDDVYSNTSMDTLLAFTLKWKEQGEFNRRFDKFRKLMSV